MTVTEFLLARITEDEHQLAANLRDADVIDTIPGTDPSYTAMVRQMQERPFRECEAKRRILDLHEENEQQRVPASRLGPELFTCAECQDFLPCPTLRALAAVYADHPDYDPAWAPA